MTLIDTHTHLYLEDYQDDRDAVIRNALEAQVKGMLLPAIDSQSFDSLKQLANQYPANCFPMAGLHPTSVKEDYEEELKLMEKALISGTYYGIGEIGIDLYWDQTFQEQQLDAFRKQLRWAKKYKLAVSIHTRNSFEEAYRIVKEELTDDLTGVFHCFTGTFQEASMIMDLGFYMGIGGILTFKNSTLGEVVKKIPMHHLVLETDSPFLTPAPYRGKRNQSAYLIYVAEKMAEIKNLPLEEVAEQTTLNAKKLFKLQNF